MGNEEVRGMSTSEGKRGLSLRVCAGTKSGFVKWVLASKDLAKGEEGMIIAGVNLAI